MKKIYSLVLFLLACSAACLMHNDRGSLRHNIGRLGDAEVSGMEPDATEQYDYELKMLCDPATGKIPANMRERELEYARTLPKDGYYTTGRTTGDSDMLNWAPRGPWNVGGRTRAFAVDVNNENNLVAGSTSGGMFRSTDQGATWVATTPSNEYKSVSCLAQDVRSGHTNVWYYGTGEAYGTSASGGGAFYLGDGIYKSYDSGQTWTVLPSTTNGDLASFGIWSDISWNIVVNPADTADTAAVYVAAYGAVYQSLDGGGIWNSVLGSFGSSYFTDVAVSKSGILYATLSSDGPYGGLYRSVDGHTWTDITPDSFPTSFDRVKIGISPDNENQVYFLGNTPGYGMPDTNYLGSIEWNSLWRYIFDSGNGSGAGGRWSNRSMSLPTGFGVFNNYTCQGSYDMVVKVKPGDTSTVFIGGTCLYRSTTAFADNAHTFYVGGYVVNATLPVVNDYPNHHPDQHELAFLPSNPNKMFSANDGGIFYTADNTAPVTTWQSLDNGYITTMFYTCAIDHATTSDIIIGGAQDNGSWFTNSTDVHVPWVSPRGGDGTFCAIADSGKAFYFSIQDCKMMRAVVDNSGTVDSFARIDPIGAEDFQFVNPYVLDPNNNNILYLAGGHFLWRNNNLSGIPYADNWDSISTNWVRFPDSIATSDTPITALSVSTTPANRVYFGTAEKLVYRVDSANTGIPTYKNIIPAIAGIAFPFGYVNCIAIDPTNADNIIVVFSNYNVYSLFYSTDGGGSWQKIGGNLEQNNRNGTGDGPSCRWASIIPLPDGYVYLVGTSVGLFGTTQLNDTSTVWTQLGTSTIGAAVVDHIDYRLTDGLVVVATHSSGMYSTHITTTADLDGIKPVANQSPDFSFVNYPNPFSNSTTLAFTLPQSNQVSIALYNQAGQWVANIASGVMQAGEHKIVFVKSGFPPGVYYCTLQAGNLFATNKFLIIE